MPLPGGCSLQPHTGRLLPGGCPRRNGVSAWPGHDMGGSSTVTATCPSPLQLALWAAPYPLCA